MCNFILKMWKKVLWNQYFRHTSKCRILFSVNVLKWSTHYLEKKCEAVDWKWLFEFQSFMCRIILKIKHLRISHLYPLKHLILSVLFQILYQFDSLNISAYKFIVYNYFIVHQMVIFDSFSLLAQYFSLFYSLYIIHIIIYM